MVPPARRGAWHSGQGWRRAGKKNKSYLPLTRNTRTHITKFMKKSNGKKLSQQINNRDRKYICKTRKKIMQLKGAYKLFLN